MSERIDKNNETVVIDISKCTGCSNCQLICSLTYEKCFNPLKAHIVVNRTPFKELYYTEDCSECNLCVKYCVYGALTEREEAA